MPDNTSPGRSLSNPPDLPNQQDFLARGELVQLNDLKYAVWIFDIERRRMRWANPAAVCLWNSDSLDDLLSRDWSTDMSATTRIRVDDYLKRFAEGETITEQWTFYPFNEGPVTVKCVLSGIRIEDGRLAMLVKARTAGNSEFSPEELRGIEALRHTSVIISLYDMDGHPLFQNPAAIQAFGGSYSFQSQFESSGEADSVWQTVVEHGYYTGRHRIRTTHAVVWHGIDCTLSVDPVTAKSAILVNQRDIHKEWWSESILDWNAKVLEHIAADKPLQALLETIVEMTEATEPEMICSIALVDEQTGKLRCKAAPSLPDDFNAALELVEIGPEIGSCGAAAYLGETVIVEDILEHPNWQPYLEVVKKAGLRACWSVPVKSSEGTVLGTFAAYFRTPLKPRAEHLNLLEMAGVIVELAIKRHNEKFELVAARQRAENANKAKSDFLSIMSHELRTPLTSSLGSLGLLDSLMADDLPEQANELIDIAIRNNNTLLRLVNELLDYEKILSGTLAIETQVHDIVTLTANSVRDLQGLAQTQSVQFVFDEPGKALYAEVQEYRYGQILTNLLSNAAKFSGPGTDVTISVEQDNGFVYVHVSDKGPGIPEQFRDKIYEQFTQYDSSTTRQHGGTGLGLAISKALTEGMSGHISFETETGVGSTFSLRFPSLSVPD